MKRGSILALALGLCLALTACGGQQTQTETKSKEIALNALYNPQTGVTLTLGETRTEMEKSLGQGKELSYSSDLLKSTDFIPMEGESGQADEEKGVQVVSYGQGEDAIVVTYLQDMAVSIGSYHLYTGEKQASPFRWQSAGGITYGSSLADLTTQYPDGKTMALNQIGQTEQSQTKKVFQVIGDKAAVTCAMDGQDKLLSFNLSQPEQTTVLVEENKAAAPVDNP